MAEVTTTHLRFPGGQQAHAFVSWLHRFKEQKPVLVGDAATGVFDASAYVDEPCEIGAGTRICHLSHVLAGTTIGRDRTLGQNVMVRPWAFVAAGAVVTSDVPAHALLGPEHLEEVAGG